MEQLSLRPAVNTDAEFAYTVEEDAMRRYAEQTWGKWNPAASRDSHISSFDASAHSVIEVNGRGVGILSVEKCGDHLLVAKLYILCAHRDGGIGSKVLASVLSEAKSKSQSVRLHTLAVNTRAQKFYERHGFTVEARTPERVHMVYERVA
jgi:ribosomal protein S18 acetylase RimI-like enzyme